MKEGRITFRQFAAAAVVSTFSPISRLLPKVGLEIAGRACWIGPLLAFLPLLCLCFLIQNLLAGEERGLCGALETALGTWAGRIVSVLLGLWIIFYGGFLIRSGAERYLSTVYKDEALWFYLITIGGTALIAALGRMRSISRMAQLCSAIVGAALIILFALGLPDIKKYYLLPVNVLEGGRIAASALPALNVATSWVFLSFLSGYVLPESYKKRTLVKWAAYIIVIIEVIVVATVGALGPKLSESQPYPFFVLISNLKVFNIFERIEPVTVMIWVLTDFVFIAMLMMSSGEIGKNIANGRSRRWPVLVSAALMIVVSFVISGNAFEFTFVSEKLIPLVNLSLAAVFIPVLCLIKKVKKR